MELDSRVAVLETKVEGIDKKLDELKTDISDVHSCVHKTRELIIAEIKALRADEAIAHKEIDKRITALEQWRWYILGIAATVGWLFSHTELAKTLLG